MAFHEDKPYTDPGAEPAPFTHCLVCGCPIRPTEDEPFCSELCADRDERERPYIFEATNPSELADGNPSVTVVPPLPCGPGALVPGPGAARRAA